jgi:hypothetical protein
MQEDTIYLKAGRIWENSIELSFSETYNTIELSFRPDAPELFPEEPAGENDEPNA